MILVIPVIPVILVHQCRVYVEMARPSKTCLVTYRKLINKTQTRHRHNEEDQHKHTNTIIFGRTGVRTHTGHDTK